MSLSLIFLVVIRFVFCWLMNSLWYSNTSTGRFDLVTINILAIIVRGALIVFQMLSIVELRLESTGSLTCQKLIQQSSWASIARRSTLLELIN